MKYIKTLISMAVCGVVMAFAVNASAQSEGMATIVRIQGEARYSTGDNIWHPLEVGLVLRSGAIVQTAAGATVDIVLDDKKAKPARSSAGGGAGGAGASGAPAAKQNVVRMFGDTVLAIDKLLYSQTGAEAVTDTELDLRAGKIFGSVKKLSAASKYEIKTPTGIAGIRGTSFGIGADGSVTVYEGSVMVSHNGGTPVLVPAGSNVTFDNDGTPHVVVVVPPGQTTETWASQAMNADGAPPTTTVTPGADTSTTTQGNTTVYVSPTAG